MQHDDVIWGTLNDHFCSYKVKTVKQKFCRNKYNLTGICEKRSCPLANSRYATIVENTDALYLFIKTAERAHSPRNLWERIKLSPNYRRALTQLDKHLEYWPTFQIHKAKQRLTKMTQYLIRKRRIQLRSKTRLVGIKKKVERREESREKKAVNAAKLETAIEKELLERLRSGAYGDIYNFAQDQYEKVLQMEEEGEMEDEEELASGDEYEAEYEQEEESDEELVEDIEDGGAIPASGDFDFDDESDGDSDGDDGESDEVQPDDDEEDVKKYIRERARKRLREKKDDAAAKKRKKGRRLRDSRGGVRVEVEYEREAAAEPQTR